MTVELNKLKEELVSLFLKYEVVPQGYDFELWTKEDQDNFVKRYPKGNRPFDEIVNITVKGMLGL